MLSIGRYWLPLRMESGRLSARAGRSILLIEQQTVAAVPRMFLTYMSGAVFDCSGMVLLLVARGLGAGVFLFRFANGEWQYRGELEPIPHQGVITKRLQKILLRDNRLIFVYNSRIRKYDVETGKLVYNKAVRHAFETEGENLTQKLKGIYRTGFY